MRSPNGLRITRACEYCGKVVELHPSRAAVFHYCSGSCRARANPKKRMGVNKKCQRCGKEFYVPQNRKDAATYCSQSCASAAKLEGGRAPWWKGGAITFDCIVCGKTTTRTRGNTGGTYQFCSNHCHDVYRRKRETGTCANCGKTFERQKSRSKRYDREYCSFICYAAYAVGENSLHWRGGEKDYPAEFNAKFKCMIRERDNYTCAVCKQYGDSVHHINYVKNDTFPRNCITLCRSCHGRTNSNRPYWIEYFSKIMPSYS
jgi:endogenous inhibitor of DNA gyrase (YacG/DUF329 family)